MPRPVDSGNLFSEAWKAAQARHTAQRETILDKLPQTVRETPRSFEAELSGASEQVLGVDESVHAVDALPKQLVTGEIKDFHEVAAQLKRSELTFKFALEVRNKLIDAYREVMRMSV